MGARNSLDISEGYAPQYADCGIATTPVDGREKKPLVNGPRFFGIRASLKLAGQPKFADASIGLWCGERTLLTVVDVDEPGEGVRQRAVQLFGDTPIQARTHSGKSHLYYRHNGERRMIHPNSRPLDILGNGLVVLPQSEGERRT